MYEVSVDELQRTIKIYDTSKGESAENKTRYSTSMILTDLALGECRIHFAQGRLNEHINKLVFLTVKQLGYKQAQLEVPTGTPASRMAEYQYTRNGLDRYIVRLDSGVDE